MKTTRGPFFVVGTGRCGSTLLSDMIRLHPRVLDVSEWFTVLGEHLTANAVRVDAHAYRRLLTIPSADVSELTRRYPQLPELCIPSDLAASKSSEIPPVLLAPLPRLAADPLKALRELDAYLESCEPRTLAAWHTSSFEFLAQRQSKETWVERSGGSLAYADALVRCWPNARFIHLYRDGVDCAESMSRHPYFRVRLARAQTRSALPLGDCLARNLPIEHFGVYWSAVVMRGLNTLRALPRSDVIHLSYQDLVDNPHLVLRRLQHFMEEHVGANAWVERASKLVRRPATRPRKAGPEVERLRRVCAIGMRELEALAAHP